MNVDDKKRLDVLKELSILYVEDEKDIREPIIEFLKRRAKEIYSATNGVEGLDLYVKYSPDIVITDINMPKMNGLEMSARIKDINRNAQIIIMTAHSQEELLLKAIEIGINRYVLKPVEREKLMEAIFASVDIIVLEKEVEEQKKKLEEMATKDMLTGIYNRQKFNEILSIEFYKNKRYGRISSIIMFDIDYFKTVNDNYGHLVGDEVLKWVCKQVKENIRVSDAFARWGGEEFVILASETNLEDGVKLAEKLRKIIEDGKFRPDLKITCSFGVTQTDGSEEINQVIKRCDDALYSAKRNGRNRVEFAAI